ncbi:hypothetical protein ACFQRK_03775 [Parapedobacter sp. GCM10030251]|uniref:hypothetical protein n=1 Tax=Parapedobacter sp. GCM10030251 TaxID=3273419 RepID=UPI003609D817
MSSDDKKLIDEIRDSLLDFEIPYEEGNWENFQKLYGQKLDEDRRKPTKTRFFFWKYVSAAVILIGVLVYIPWDRSGKRQIDPESRAKQETTSITEQRLALPKQPNAESVTGDTLRPTFRPPEKTRVATTYERLASITRTIETNIPKAQATLPLALPAISREDMNLSLGSGELIVDSHSQEMHMDAFSRWKFGLEVNSSLTGDHVNFAAGVFTQFDLSEKIKLATGLTYARVSAIHETDPVPLSYDTKILGGESTIKAIDIPLTVVYEPADGWYASVGISALAVLDERKTYRMESEVLRESVTIDPESGASVAVFEVVKTEYQKESVDTDFEGRGNLGYLNLSIGRKQRFNKRTDMLFEPFIKIPMGGLQRDHVNLFNSGLRIKVLF